MAIDGRLPGIGREKRVRRVSMAVLEKKPDRGFPSVGWIGVKGLSSGHGMVLPNGRYAHGQDAARRFPRAELRMRRVRDGTIISHAG